MLFEEAKDLPAEEVNAVVIPLLNIVRFTATGDKNPNEIHHQQLYVGSAGQRNTFAYDKCIEVAVISALQPDKGFCWGGDWRIPVHYGLLSKEFVLDQKNSGTYDEADFAREYGSKWTSQNAGSLFDFDRLTSLRVINKAEWRPVDRPNVRYFLSIDVARSKARTVLEVIKVIEGEEAFTKNVVNILTLTGGSFSLQAEKIKEIDAIFNFERIVIDGNGLGVGLIDFLMVETQSADKQKIYPPYNVSNIKDFPDYAPDQKIGAPYKIHIIKTNQSNAGKIHSACYADLFSGRVKLLVDPKTAREKLLSTEKGRRMGMVERDRFLAPYTNTTLLVDETSNLKINKQVQNFKIELLDPSKEKDTFSALEYGLWYIREVEQTFYARKRKNKTKWSYALRVN